MHTPSPDADPQPTAAWWRRLCGWLWKASVVFGTVVVASLGVNLLSTWLTSSKGIFPTDSPLARLLTQWPLVLAIRRSLSSTA
ncbi:MAG TPA: hypothetical protein VHZ51_14130 [Ktedonobacteraceae bacterium]|nr:hypothetical protein [Ktedonobacteraceae bacterium]